MKLHPTHLDLWVIHNHKQIFTFPDSPNLLRNLHVVKSCVRCQLHPPSSLKPLTSPWGDIAIVFGWHCTTYHTYTTPWNGWSATFLFGQVHTQTVHHWRSKKQKHLERNSIFISPFHMWYHTCDEFTYSSNVWKQECTRRMFDLIWVLLQTGRELICHYCLLMWCKLTWRNLRVNQQFPASFRHCSS